MIKFIDDLKTGENDIIPVSFENTFWDQFLTLRIIVGIFMPLLFFVWQIFVLPFIFVFSTLDTTLEIFKYIYNYPKKIIKKREVKNHMRAYTNIIEKQDPYTLQEYTNDLWKNQHLEDFIRRFVLLYRCEFNTISSSGSIVCDRKRRRSAGDIYRICKSYYPNCTFKDVMQILILLCKNNIISGSYCGTIHKFVFHRDSTHFNTKDPVEYVRLPNVTFKDIMEYYGVK